MKTTLITGSSGFIGKKLVNKLTEKNIFDKMILPNSYEYSSLNNKKIDIVIHLGFFTPRTIEDGNNVYKLVDSIKSTVSLIKNLRPTKFIFASAIDVYKITSQRINEKTETNPTSLYGHTKLYCEKLLEAWAQQTGVLLQILRIGHIYGKGEEKYQKLIPIVIRKTLNNESIEIFGNGSDRRSYLYIEDLITYILKIIELDYSVSPINLVSKKNTYSVREVVDIITSFSDKPISIKMVKKPAVKNRDIVFDTTKLIDFFVDEIDFKDGLKKEYDSI